MSSLTLGFYYLQAVYQRNRSFMRAIFPWRCVAFVVFWPHGGAWRKVAGYEAAMGVAMVGALWWEGLAEGRERK